jgi:hypothetical protein
MALPTPKLLWIRRPSRAGGLLIKYGHEVGKGARPLARSEDAAIVPLMGRPICGASVSPEVTSGVGRAAAHSIHLPARTICEGTGDMVSCVGARKEEAIKKVSGANPSCARGFIAGAHGAGLPTGRRARNGECARLDMSRAQNLEVDWTTWLPCVGWWFVAQAGGGIAQLLK